ncbi:FCD domain-containing protein [Iocasia frigidifontis]|uniref:FCD domain-containing protein n=1 Tax=Iocasia fonsfrigidae TaxID=2682810 RepID=A0A8A7KI59_9FIRM|nr:FadR/GntR family transcriptional regulator [Iocasia fonsfrigidae]QTL99755.1 FCD domain-containing protein [Iocasia fonsfrigidae]
MKPIIKKTAVDLTVENLINYIKDGEAIIGDKLPSENELCKQMNVSRTTIREAFRVLQSKGYINIKTGKGAFVLSKKENFMQDATEWIRKHKIEMSDYIEVRIAMDPLSARLAAKNRTKEDINSLKEMQELFVASVENSDYEKMAELDAKFHERIALASNNDLLVVLGRIVNDFFKVLRKNSFKFEENAKHAILPHQKILDSIIIQDEDKAAKESLLHMRQALKDLCNN